LLLQVAVLVVLVAVEVVQADTAHLLVVPL
jgi:hypothetical protein